MKKALLLSLALVAANQPATAQTQEQMDQMKACMAQEQSKSDDTRSGVSASEFCAAVVAMGG